MSRVRSQWRTSRRTLAITRRPLLMGILNVTPDSFSDGGRFLTAGQSASGGPTAGESAASGATAGRPTGAQVDAAVQAGLMMIRQGADILDIGGESTRPYSDPVDVPTEIARVVPVIEGLLGASVAVPISIDTRHADVARAALTAGAEIINDITGLQGDAAMPDVARQFDAGVCVMHMQGTPQTMQDAPTYDDIVSEIESYLRARREACLRHQLHVDSICLDPGIGFGKTREHNLQLLRATGRFAELGSPILIGHSRKGFIKSTLKRSAGDSPDGAPAAESFDPLAGTLGVSLAVAAAGAHVLRVHDVAATAQALTMFEAAGGLATNVAESPSL